MKNIFHNIRLKTKLIIIICTVFILSVVSGDIYIINLVNKKYYDETSQNVTWIANIVASSKDLIYNIEHPTAQNLTAIQDYAEQVRKLTQVEFITIFDMNGLRFSHPHADKIGKPIVGGDGERALKGESYLSTAKGTLGLSIRAFQPIYSLNDKKQIGALMVGQTVNKIDHLTTRIKQPIILTLALSLTIAVLLAIWLSKNIKNILLGLEPTEMVKLFEERDAIIRTVKEGIVVINREGKILQINDEAIRILHLSSDKDFIIGKNVQDIIPNTRLYEVMLTGRGEYDNEQNINGVVILTNRTPFFVRGKLVGAIASFRDMTELRQLAENLTGVKNYVDALRSQSHEFNNKLHVIYGLAFSKNYERLLSFLKKFIGEHENEYNSISQSICDPTIAGFLSSKFSRARELGVIFDFHVNGKLEAVKNESITHKLVTILGNLIDNAFEAVQFLDDKKIAVNLVVDNKWFEIQVCDNGEGISEKEREHIFIKGFSTKGDNRGFGLYLVSASVNELNGKINIIKSEPKGACFQVLIPLSILNKGKKYD